MNSKNSLEVVKIQFAQWRAERTGNQRTPTALREQAVDLKKLYPVGEIVSALGIHHKTLKHWTSIHQQPQAATPFVMLPVQQRIVKTLPEKNAQDSSRFTCQLPNGIVLSVSDQRLDHDFLSSLYALNSGTLS